MTNRRLFVLFCLILCVASLSAQQITRFGVVDTARIYTAFYRDSRNVRDYELKKNLYQGDIQKMADDIKVLRQQKVDADTIDDQARVLKLESSIQSKTATLLEYSKVKNAELDSLKKKLTSDDEFYSVLYEEIRQISEADGYSMILSLQEGASIIWYSPTVDITDKVIRNMNSRK